MSALENAARRLAAATLGLHGSDAQGRLLHVLEYECALHDLIVRAGFPCPYCAEGDCPGPIGDSDDAQLVIPAPPTTARYPHEYTRDVDTQGRT